ncbi:ABC transporter permease [Hymenobacter tibetensis]|uniref:ABC transporter permease n=1 Tax=Hymenobacter tibetensis TaxID=497967 RepID=A0ABY4D384_9BACT|nr:FtsX-like permease family protein [Hymenobacter tibetensis]UOG76807.1 ABC transporter permease [Hymenobacter tibetensis]
MIRHLFTLIWNRKRANFLLVIEISLAFVVLFAVGSVLVFNQQNYRAPLGFSYEQVWAMNLDPGAAMQSEAERARTQQQIMQRLRTLPGVRFVSHGSSNLPFFDTHNSSDLSRSKKGDGVNHNIYQVDDERRAVLDLQLKAGRWFDKRDDATEFPVILTEDSQQELFGNESAVGQRLHSGDRELKVVGVVANFRSDGDLSAPKPGVFTRISPQDTSFNHLSTLLVRVQPGAGAALEKQMTKEALAIGKGWSIGVTSLTEQRAIQLKQALTPIAALVIVCVFLVVNVALGLFGVLWYNISKRRAEIGLRRALGAGRQAISGQFLGEVMVISTLGLALGLAVAAQFPLLGVLGLGLAVYGPAMLLAVLLIYILTAVCALYPSRLAAGVHPAVALREE